MGYIVKSTSSPVFAFLAFLASRLPDYLLGAIFIPRADGPVQWNSLAVLRCLRNAREFHDRLPPVWLQMRSDGIQSRFLVGNLGKVYERRDESNATESSSIDSIAALAKLNKRNPSECKKWTWPEWNLHYVNEENVHIAHWKWNLEMTGDDNYAISDWESWR